MAEIEDGRGDKGRAREWLARAVRAPSDPMWVIDGAASPYWTPVSPVTGEIAFAEWKVPFESLPRQAAPEPEPPPTVEETPLPPPEPVAATPAPPPEPAPPPAPATPAAEEVTEPLAQSDLPPAPAPAAESDDEAARLWQEYVRQQRRLACPGCAEDDLVF